MSEQSRVVTVPLMWNEHGCPILDMAGRAHLELSVHEPDFTVASRSISPQPKQVCITANREGLTALATWLLALAAPESQLDHQHFDNEVASGFYHSAQGWEMIVGRTK
ncbi:unnamed protein product [Gemmata massiliana]|uniref:Uncharacterized protein n=1 Tax=Gemmata massiliana TaxID=1210884 RepID=A0A6P2DDD1_9BACT|nr:hypothetical protein [Gemmata massiliana]VTS00097.1 unnamed protein product [Gemmata massiliana]